MPANRENRRHFLKVGSLGMGALGLDLSSRAALAAESHHRDRTVVLLFLSGGPSQFETFDPKPLAPDGIRTVGGIAPTRLPGVTFGAWLPRLAALADRFTVVRSFVSGINDHPGAARFLHLGNALQGGIGSVVARLRGAINPRTNLPGYIQLIDPSPDGQIRYYRDIMKRGNSPGAVGPSYAPLDPTGGGEFVSNMTLNIPADRFRNRLDLLAHLDSIERSLDVHGVIDSLDAQRQQAVNAILNGTRGALDIDLEPLAVRARYDTSNYPVANYAQENGRNRHPSPLGHQMLLARRLVEQGAGFVMVGNASWDMHGGNLEQPIHTGMPDMGGALDRALSAFIEDIEARGLREKVLLVVTGEMGRTPRINRDGGRDHWGRLTQLLLYGGGIRQGAVIGASDRNGGEPVHDAFCLENLMATILHGAFDIGQLRVARDVPTDLLRQINTIEPIREAME